MHLSVQHAWTTLISWSRKCPPQEICQRFTWHFFQLNARLATLNGSVDVLYRNTACIGDARWITSRSHSHFLLPVHQTVRYEQSVWYPQWNGLVRLTAGQQRACSGTRNVRRILVKGSMPPCLLRRRKLWKFDYEIVHSGVYLTKYVVRIAPFSTPACPDCSQNITQR